MLPYVAQAAEPKPFLPSQPTQPATPAETPATPEDAPEGQSRSARPATQEEGTTGIWSPTATWRPIGPSTYDEDLALAELLNMSATVASKSSATVSRSPGIVTVYGEQDIRRLGYYTLSDLADVTAGYSSYSIFGEKVFETRGQKAGSFVNNKHLVLIDGIPVNHGRGNKAMIDENFPLFFANRVEFLKGPASALYGTGAFFGVVNVVPKELEDRGFHAEWRAGFGSNQVEKRVLANAMYRDGVRHAAIYAGFYDKGPSAEFTGTADNPDNRYWDNQRSEFLYLTYGIDSGALGGMKAGFIYSSKNGGGGEYYLGGYSPAYDDLTWIQMIPYLKYERRLGRGFSVDGYLKASRDTEQASSAFTPRRITDGSGNLLLLYKFTVMAYEGLAELRWEPSERVNVIGGINVNVTYQEHGDGTFGGKVVGSPGPAYIDTPGALTSSQIFQTYSPFLQFSQTLPVLTALHLTAGARMDTGKAVDKRFVQVSPRVGLVQELTDFLGLKVLYGAALRAPGVKELGLNSENLVDLSPTDRERARNVPLKPETIQSLEGAITFNTTHVSASVAAFVNQTQSALNEAAVAGTSVPVNVFANSRSKIVARGTEVELTLAATPDARFFANFAYAKASLESEIDPARLAQLADVPIFKVNGGASYRLNKPVDVTGSLVGKWVTGYRGAHGVPPLIFPNEPSLPSSDDVLRVGDHLVVDANFVWRATEHTSLELLVRNVLNDVYKLPQGGVPVVPMPRRSVHLTLDYRW
jgi:outer membrane receptor protein involved in Fe transport